MSRFYVGQRVKILWSNGWPELAGQAGTIIGKDDTGGGLTGRSEWDVAPDCWGSNVAPRKSYRGGTEFGPSSDQLEPLYDGNQLSTWDKCVWRPSPELVR